ISQPGTPMIAGEKGPEAVIPLLSGAIPVAIKSFAPMFGFGSDNAQLGRIIDILSKTYYPSNPAELKKSMDSMRYDAGRRLVSYNYLKSHGDDDAKISSSIARAAGSPNALQRGDREWLDTTRTKPKEKIDYDLGPNMELDTSISTDARAKLAARGHPGPFYQPSIHQPSIEQRNRETMENWWFSEGFKHPKLGGEQIHRSEEPEQKLQRKKSEAASLETRFATERSLEKIKREESMMSPPEERKTGKFGKAGLDFLSSIGEFGKPNMSFSSPSHEHGATQSSKENNGGVIQIFVDGEKKIQMSMKELLKSNISKLSV
ncbi:MAG: hypothetical protein Q7R33_07675, partial [Nitrosarchaeum sp.]|nr:hypothetical protein [Nitrosarchaeum sp.]